MDLYSSKIAEGYEFLLGILMRFIPEINMILNMKQWKNVDKLEHVRTPG